jgi:hypothetical protein
MARGPDGTLYDEPASEPGSDEDGERGLAHGLERIIDRSLQRHRPGERFVYGIHQSLSPRLIATLESRYRAAGWREATVREGATGAFVLILAP